jgi:hypothetical protein
MNGFGPADFPGTPAASKPAAAAFSLFAKSAGITAHFVDSGKAILAVHEALTTLGKDRGIAAQTTIGTSLARSMPMFTAAGALVNDRPREQRPRRRKCP